MSSLRALDRVEDRIRQHRQVVRDPVLLVEGPGDLLVLSHHVPRDRIFPADGKGNLIRALRALRDCGQSEVFGVADADFDDPADASDLVDSLLYFEGRDLEAMLVRLGVLSLVLEHQGSANKLAAKGGAATFVDSLIDTVSPVTALRAANARAGWGLRFDAVDLVSKADRHTLAIAIDRLCQAIVDHSDTAVSAAEALGDAASVEDDGLGPRGKDVVALAGLALRSVVGSLSSQATAEPVLTSQLHSSSGLALSRTDWLAKLRAKVGAV